MARKAGRKSWGSVRQLPSGRYQARYTRDGVSYRAPMTFDTAGDADTYLATVRADIAHGLWAPPSPRQRPLTLREYAVPWLSQRTLKPRTREHYTDLLDKHLLPTFGPLPLREITPESVRTWHAKMGPSRPTLRAHAYGLLRTILADATADELIPVNPCHIRGAGQARRAHKIRPASLPEIEKLTAAMPTRYRAMVLLAAWCGLRFGELAELRRHDVDLKAGVLRIRRAVVRVDSKPVVTTPKTDAGVRDVTIPPHLLPLLKAHLTEHTEPGRDALLFPAAGGGHLAPSSLYRVYYPAREAAGRPDLRWHDLRHTGAVLAATTGATLAELMVRLGHSTPGAAMRYQHAAADRDRVIAEALSAMATGASS